MCGSLIFQDSVRRRHPEFLLETTLHSTHFIPGTVPTALTYIVSVHPHSSPLCWILLISSTSQMRKPKLREMVTWLVIEVGFEPRAVSCFETCALNSHTAVWESQSMNPVHVLFGASVSL